MMFSHVFTVAGVSVFVCLLPSLYESSSKPNIMILRLDEIMARGAKHNNQRNRGSQKSTINQEGHNATAANTLVTGQRVESVSTHISIH